LFRYLTSAERFSLADTFLPYLAQALPGVLPGVWLGAEIQT